MIRRPMLFSLVALLALEFLAPAAPARAQVQLDRRRPAAARGSVSIDNAFGTVVVRGWDRNEVAVQGTLAAGAESFDFDGEKGETSISVSVPEEWFSASGEDPAFRTTLTVSVPAGSRVAIETVNASIQVDAVSGKVEVQTVNGATKIAGPVAAVEIDSMTGGVEVHAASAPMDVQTISGAITLEGATGEVRIETVSGKVAIAGAAVSDLGVRTTTGDVTFHGSLAKKGSLEVETFSSPVRLVLPRATQAVFDLQTFDAKIQSDFCAGTPVTRKRFEPFRQLRCSTGPDDFEIRVRTHDADITLAAE